MTLIDWESQNIIIYILLILYIKRFDTDPNLDLKSV